MTAAITPTERKTTTGQECDDGLLQDLSRGSFDFADLGCGTGESITYCQKRFRSGPGLGFDISDTKIEKARAAGYSIAHADVTQLDFPDNCVSYCTMLDFLEHLYSEEDACRILSAAGRMARDFLFIRHPSFEDIDFLAEHNLKLGWTDWRGHRNPLLLSDYDRIFRSFGWSDYVVIHQKQIVDSQHSAIVPVTAPTDTVRYDPDVHGPKPRVSFHKAVWTQFDIFVRLNPEMSDDRWDRIIASVLRV